MGPGRYSSTRRWTLDIAFIPPSTPSATSGPRVLSDGVSVMKMCVAIKRGIYALARLFEYICWFVLLGWVALMTAGVIARYVLRSPLIYQVDLVSLALVIFASFCVAPVFLKNEHIRVDLITRHLPKRVQDVLLLIAEGILLLFSVLIIYSSTDLIAHSLEVSSRTEVSNIPLTPFILCIPLGFGLLVMVLVVDLSERLYTFLISQQRAHKG